MLPNIFLTIFLLAPRPTVQVSPPRGCDYNAIAAEAVADQKAGAGTVRGEVQSLCSICSGGDRKAKDACIAASLARANRMRRGGAGTQPDQGSNL